MKKLSTIFFGALLLASCSDSASYKSFVNEINNSTIVPIVKEDTTGKEMTVYIDENGKEMFGKSFTTAYYFHDGLALVAVEEKVDEALVGITRGPLRYGYINTNGEYAIEPKYASATDFCDGIAWVAEPDSALKAIDTKGKVLFRFPEAYSAGLFLSDGLARFDSFGETSIGFVNKKGETFSFEGNADITRLSFATPYVLVINREGSNKLMKLNGKEFTECAVSENFNVTDWSEEAKLAVIRQGDQYGLADENGQLVVNPQYSYLSKDGKWFIFQNEKDKYGWIDGKGNEMIAPKYKKVTGFQTADYCAVSVNGSKYQVINRKGETVIPSKYEDMRRANETLFFIKNDAGWGIADATTGEVVCKPQFSNIQPRSNYVFIASSGDDKWGVINKEGKYLSALEYSGRTNNSAVRYSADAQTVSPESYASYLQTIANGMKDQHLWTVGRLMDYYDTSESSILYADGMYNYNKWAPLQEMRIGENGFIYLNCTTAQPVVTYPRYSSRPRLNRDAQATDFTIGFTEKEPVVKEVARLGITNYGWKLAEDTTMESFSDITYFWLNVSDGTVTINADTGDEYQDDEFEV